MAEVREVVDVAAEEASHYEIRPHLLPKPRGD
jgi:hypothetical protein